MAKKQAKTVKSTRKASRITSEHLGAKSIERAEMVSSESELQEKIKIAEEKAVTTGDFSEVQALKSKLRTVTAQREDLDEAVATLTAALNSQLRDELKEDHREVSRRLEALKKERHDNMHLVREAIFKARAAIETIAGFNHSIDLDRLSCRGMIPDIKSAEYREGIEKHVSEFPNIATEINKLEREIIRMKRTANSYDMKL